MNKERHEPPAPPRNNDDQVTQPDMGSAVDDADRRFSRHLFGLDTEWSALAAALRVCDPLKIESSAQEVVDSWRAAKAAAEVLEMRVTDLRTRVNRAKSALRHHSLALGDLFRRALARTEGTELHGRLLRLSTELALTGGAGSVQNDAGTQSGEGLSQDDIGSIPT